MSIVTDTGFVIYSAQMGEADSRARILSKTSGKFTGIFKGLKKSRRRSHTAVEPGTLLQVTFNSGRSSDLLVIRDFDIIDTAEKISRDYHRFLSFCFILEVIDQTTAFFDPVPEIFRFLHAARSSIMETPFPVQCASFSIVRLLVLHGLIDRDLRCPECGKSVEVSACYDRRKKFICCMNCAGKDQYFIDSDVFNLLNDSLNKKFSEIDFKIHTVYSARNLIDMMVLMTQDIFGCKIKSAEILNNSIV